MSFILLVNDVSMPGGLATISKNIYSRIKSDGMDIKLLTATNSNSCLLNDGEIDLGLPLLHGRNIFYRLFWYLSLIFVLRKLLVSDYKTCTFVPIGTMMSLCVIISKLLSHNFDGKIIATEHVPYVLHSKFILFLIRYLYKFTSSLAVLSEYDKDYYSIYLDNVVVMPNFLENSKKNFKVAKTISLPTKFLYVGRFTKEKGVDRLVDIFYSFKKLEKLEKRETDSVLTIVGEGPLESYLKQKIEDYNLNEYVEIHPPVTNVINLYNSSDVLLVCSRFEGFGLVALEAYYSGVPIIAFDCPGGLSDIVIQDENGYLVKDTDEFDYVTKMLVLSVDEEQRLRLSNSLVLGDRYSASFVINLWYKLFFDVCQCSR
ncbi:glycosyltransferase [Vibrio cyclitrophicus]|uniref:glycosyltransferase n=1 Tax=Vibrio cyclitrophicus TaxID=47951 RepID=UPI0021C3068E|nr:glycosyltransferase [Vibrio cyclitrophicus]